MSVKPARRGPCVNPQRESLATIGEKVAVGARLSLDDGEALFRTPDIWRVCELADLVRRRMHGTLAYYNVNRHMNYSNVCALSCKFCEFYAKEGQEKAYTRDLDYIRDEARKAVESGATEMHIVGGLHPRLPFAYYTDMLAAIREVAEQCAGDGCGRLHIKAFTAVEIVHLAKMARQWKGASLAGDDGRQARLEGIRWVLSRLMEAGLGSLPGGGAETFDDRVHDEAFKGKIRSDVWLDVHRVAHQLGLNTNATILYGHIENIRERLVHMDMLRRAQDEALAGPSGTGRFQTIIPLPFIPDGSELGHLPGPMGLENLRMLAVCRLMLDNFAHVKAFWIMQTLSMAQVMLRSGADDMDGTVVWYDITKVGGSSTHQEVTVSSLQRVIREAGFEPVERDTLYRRVARDGARWRVMP